jgi:hypothetical protein
VGRQRPRSRTAEQRDELAPSHCLPKLGTSRIWLSTQAIKAGICDQRYGAQMVSFALQKF